MTRDGDADEVVELDIDVDVIEVLDDTDASVVMGLAPIPTVAPMTRPQVSLEVVAIAVAVFALMQSLVWLPLPVELVWVALAVLAAKRRDLYDRGQDIVFAKLGRRGPRLLGERGMTVRS